MKISSLTESSTTSGSVATVTQPMSAPIKRGKGSMFQGIKTSKKYANSLHEAQSLGEGAKVDRMVGHIKTSEKKLGKSGKEAENIAWATANKRGMLDNKNKKVKESSEYTPPKLGTVKANLMKTKEPTVQVQVFKHNTLRGDSYWVTKEVKKFKSIEQAQAYVDRINKQGLTEARDDWDTNSPSWQKREQGYMDQNARGFKRDEHDAEWEQEQRIAQANKQRDEGVWYVRSDGKVLRTDDGQPKEFYGKKNANTAGVAHKRQNPDADAVLTTNPQDKDSGLAEARLRENDVVLTPGKGRQFKPGLLSKPEAKTNPTDTVKLDVPLLIRLMEYAKEDAVDDVALHDLAEKLVAGCQRGRTLSMKDYDNLVPKSEKEMDEDATSPQDRMAVVKAGMGKAFAAKSAPKQPEIDESGEPDQPQDKMAVVKAGMGKAFANKSTQTEMDEGRMIKGAGGVPLDRRGNPIPPKVPNIRTPIMKTPKHDLLFIWRKVEEVVGNMFPDGDPIDYLGPWVRKNNIDWSLVNKACRKFGGVSDVYAYWDQMTVDYPEARSVDENIEPILVSGPGERR